nr:ABC transporter permease [Saprospiraceae bacterium]
MREILFIGKKIINNKGGFTHTILNVGITSLSLCLAVIIVSTCMVTGFKSEIRNKVFGFWGHIHVTHTGSWRSVETLPIEKNRDFVAHLDTLKGLSYESPMVLPFTDIGIGSYQRLKHTRGGVKQIHSFVNQAAILSTADDFEGIILKGIGPDFDWDYMSEYLRQGEILEFSDSLAERAIIVSDQTAQRLRLEVGDPIIINFIIENQQRRRRVEVKGIYKTGLEEYDRRFALVDQLLIQQILGWDKNKVSGFEIFLDYVSDIEYFNEYIYLDLLPAELTSEPITRRFPVIFEWLELQDINEKVILILMLIVGIITMTTSLLILILDRTRMIGVLKSVGATNQFIRNIFLYYALHLIFKGVFIGNAVGLGLAYIQYQFEIIKLNEADYYLDVAPVHFPWDQILLLNFVFVGIIMLILMIPASVISKVDPVKVLRFK